MTRPWVSRSELHGPCTPRPALDSDGSAALADSQASPCGLREHAAFQHSGTFTKHAGY